MNASSESLDSSGTRGELRGAGGLVLRTRRWLPAGEPRALFVLVHGLAEHAGRYAGLVRAMRTRGFAVFALDHRGHGESGGRRAQIDRFDFLIEDLTLLVDSARAAFPRKPLVLFGHSMGGAIAFAWAVRHPDELAALILSGPLLGIDGAAAASPLRLALVRTLSRLAPNLPALTLPADAVSRDPESVRAYESDPLVHRGAIPARTAAELMQHVGAFAAGAPSLRMPVLVLHGTGDRLVPLAATLPVVQAIGSRDKTVRHYEGLYHELLNEPERAQVLADIVGWLEARGL